MQLNNLRILWTLLLYFLSVTTAVCSTEEVPGLDIRKIFSPLIGTSSATHSPPPAHLDELLSKCNFSGTHICYNVVVAFAESDGNNSESGSELTNTDLESIDLGKRAEDKDKKAPNKKAFLFALNAPPNDNDSKKRYLLRADESNVDQAPSTEHLCKKLAKDALQIANAHKHARTRDSTTCLCVVLRDKDSHAKKFVFHNGKDKISTTMEQKAQELKYAVRTGYQAHAEAEFIQFLLQRTEQNPGRYTHILGMGCSRRHCKECNCLLKLFLGVKYHEFTAAMCTENPALPEFTEVEDRCCICPKTYHNPVHQSQAVNHNGRRSDKYYLPKTLQEYIQNRVGLNLDFSNERFVIKNEDTMVEQRNRKRKTSTLTPGNQE